MIGTLRRALLRNWRRLLGSFSGQRHESDLAEEFEAHIQLLTEENLRRGLGPEEARRRARLQFGGIESAKDSYRDQRSLRGLDALGKDFRYALRGLRKNPGFAITVIVVLAIGLGANTTLFSIVNAVLLRPLPYPEPDRLVWVGETRADLPFSSTNPGALSYQNFLDWRKQQTVFESIGAYQPAGGSPAAFLIGGEPVRMEIQRMSADVFAALKVAPVIGRVFNNDEDRPGAAARLVVLSYDAWQRRFGGIPVVGQSVSMNGFAYTALGVMPPGFSFPYNGVEAWLPLGGIPAPPRTSHTGHAGENLGAIARLRPGVTLEQARAEMATITARLEHAYPDANKGWRSRVEPLMNVVIGDAGRPLWILFGAVGMVLLIACSNVANILLARASVRQQEMGVRAVLGASRGRIVQQLLVESLVLSFIGAALGLLLAGTGIDVFVLLAASAIPRSTEIRLDAGVLAFAAGLAGLTTVVFGLAPASMSSGKELRESLQAAGDRGGGGERRRMRQTLIVAEVALTILLLTGAGLLLRSFQRLQSVNQGFNTEHLLSFDVTLPGAKYRTPELQSRFFESLIEQLRTLPGVEEAGTTSRVPLQQKRGDTFPGIPYSVEGQEKPSGSPPDVMEGIIASPGYFRAIGIQLLRGRLFTEQDGLHADNAVIVDEEFVKRHWPGEDPIGRRIRFGAGFRRHLTVVGVVARVKLNSLSEQGGFVQAYLAARQFPDIKASVVVKSRLAPAALVGSIREQVRSLDPAQPIHNLRTVEEIRDSSLAAERLSLSVLGVFALVALSLSVVGLYGVLAYSVARRRREIGVRTALGAQRGDVVRMVIGEGMRLTSLGILAGILGALWLTQWLSSLLFEIRPSDPATFSAVSLLLLVVALIACWIPARRAARIDPIQALREQ
ncbi:MAG: ABC transporter permease [Vicinamibacterales bacterium]